MKSLLSAIVMLMSCTTVLVPAMAGDAAPGVKHRQIRQKERIREGVHSGELTREEAHTLRAQQRAIAAEKREFKADGQLSDAERHKLRQDQRDASRDIRREKHDSDRR